MRGGARPGGGRPKKIDEERVQKQSLEAITKKYGSVEKGFQSLLESKEPSLIKFCWEHAVGKPREKLDIDAYLEIEQITGMDFTPRGNEPGKSDSGS